MNTIAVAIATKGRPSDLGHLLRILRRQTVLPDRIIISACDLKDINEDDRGNPGIEIVLGSVGLCAQRNRVLACTTDVDTIIFFDDDFVPSNRWVERARALMMVSEDVVCVTGCVLADGVKTGGLTWEAGQSLVDKKDNSAPEKLRQDSVVPIRSPYGCNMAFRRKAIAGLEFDERLVMYGWLEDLDFGSRVSKRGQTVYDAALWGVHLGARRGRVSGVNYGYSQVINPWYLMRKRTMCTREAIAYVVRAIAGNLVRAATFDHLVDRLGRLRGNIIGVVDVVTGRWRPERAAEL
jgi:glycosyltransferase involved in cell wall biosynthesis